MKRVGLAVLIICLALVGLFVSCKNEIEPIQESEILVSVGFSNSGSRALSSNLEAFNAADYYWAYAAQKADSSRLRSGETATYTEADAKWVKADDNVPVKGLSNSQGLYKVEGFSQGLWNFKLFAYKDAAKTQLVYQGETTGVLLKSSATNAVANHTVNVIVSPVSSGNGTLQILTASSETDHITMTLLQAYASQAPEYGVDYFPRVLSISTLDSSYEYVDSIEDGTGTVGANATISLPAGTYKVTVSFSNAADDSATVNYARGTVIATVYSYLTTTIKGNLNEADVYAEFTSNQSINTVTSGTGTDAVEVATIAAAAAAEASSVAEPTTVSSSNIANTESAKTTISSTATAVEVAGDKKTTVTIPAAGLADTVVTKTLTSKTDDSNKTVTTVTESSTHDLSMKVTDTEATTTSSTFQFISEGDVAVAGVNLTLTKTTTTITETATTTSGNTVVETTSETVEAQDPVTSFNNKFVTVSTYIDTGLSGVNVIYDGTTQEGYQLVFNSANQTPSVEIASNNDGNDPAGTGYNPTTGLLVFKTNHFSSYIITSAPALVVTEGESVVASFASLAAFRDAVNAGTSFAGQTVTLKRDVDLTGIDWTPIGTSSNPFRGTFDGASHTINNLSNHGFTSATIDRSYSNSTSSFALFGYLRGNVTIKDLTVYVYAADVQGKGYAGVVGLLTNDYVDSGATTADSICHLNLQNITVYGEIVAADKVAGVIAQVPNYGRTQPVYFSTTDIDSCVNYATVTGERAGGILSVNSGAESGYTHITNCANHGTLSAPADGQYSVAAGIIAQTNTSNQNCYSVVNCTNDGTINASIAYGLTANVFLHYPSAETYLPVTQIGGEDNVITDPAKLMALYYSFSGEAIHPVRWKEVEYIVGNNVQHSNVDHTGLLAGEAYDVGASFVAQYDYTVGNNTYTYKFTDMTAAMSRFNTGSNYAHLTLSADAEWTAANTQKGDAPGYYSIDLGGHVLTVNAPIHVLDSNNNGLQKTVCISNGTIAYGNDYHGYLFEGVERYGRIDFSNVTLDSSVANEITSIYPSTTGSDPITINIDSSCEGFIGKTIRCLSPNTGGGDVLNLSGESITMSDSRWVSDGNSGQKTLQIATPLKQVLISKTGVTSKYMSLAGLRDSVNAGTTYEGYTITLQGDVDLNGAAWTPIGTKAHPFSGVFDGQGYTISNFNVTDVDYYAALFGYVVGQANTEYDEYSDIWENNALNETHIAESRYTAGIKNVIISGANCVSAKKFAAGLVAFANNVYLYNCSVANSIIQTGKVAGGLAAALNGSVIKGCQSYASNVVTVTGYHASGLVGYLSYYDADNQYPNPCMPSAVINCTNSANLDCSNSAGNGGCFGGILAGVNNTQTTDIPSAVINCVNNGNIIISGGNNYSQVGGIVGSGQGISILAGCLNTGAITLSSSTGSNLVSGIVASMTGGTPNGRLGLYNCENRGSVSAIATSNSNYVAGIIASANNSLFTIDGCLNTGSISCKDANEANIGYVSTILSQIYQASTVVYKNMEYADLTALSNALPQHYGAESKTGSITIDSSIVVDDKSGILELGYIRRIVAYDGLCTQFRFKGTVPGTSNDIRSSYVDIPNAKLIIGNNETFTCSVLALEADGMGIINDGTFRGGVELFGDEVSVTNNGTFEANNGNQICLYGATGTVINNGNFGTGFGIELKSAGEFTVVGATPWANSDGFTVTKDGNVYTVVAK